MKHTGLKITKNVLLLSSIFIAACTWVQTSEQGGAVRLLSDSETESCERIASVTTSVKDRVGPIDRNTDRVHEELITLAKNRTAELGGNAIVELQPPDDGEGSFAAYRCP
jgi:hypothetical protein